MPNESFSDESKYTIDSSLTIFFAFQSLNGWNKDKRLLTYLHQLNLEIISSKESTISRNSIYQTHLDRFLKQFRLRRQIYSNIPKYFTMKLLRRFVIGLKSNFKKSNSKKTMYNREIYSCFHLKRFALVIFSLLKSYARLSVFIMSIILGRKSTDRPAATIFYSFLIVPAIIYNIPLIFCFLIGITRNKNGKDGKRFKKKILFALRNGIYSHFSK